MFSLALAFTFCSIFRPSLMILSLHRKSLLVINIPEAAMPQNAHVTHSEMKAVFINYNCLLVLNRNRQYVEVIYRPLSLHYICIAGLLKTDC